MASASSKYCKIDEAALQISLVVKPVYMDLDADRCLQGSPPVHLENIACTSHRWEAAALTHRAENQPSISVSSLSSAMGGPLLSVPSTLVLQLKAMSESAESQEGDWQSVECCQRA